MNLRYKVRALRDIEAIHDYIENTMPWRRSESCVELRAQSDALHFFHYPAGPV
jgi:plasmid stabilization system protein ParE